MTRQQGGGRRLSRRLDGRPAAPVRLVHVGLGNFSRANTFWYTEHAPDAEAWGIAAFTGQPPAPGRADVADLLRAQDGLYTLITRQAQDPSPASQDGGRDRFEVISALTAVHTPDQFEALAGYLVDPNVAIVTLTVTEAGYHRQPDGRLDLANDQVARDLRALAAGTPQTIRTVPVKLAACLARRWLAGGQPLTILPCDNLMANGQAARQVVVEAADRIGGGLTRWIERNVSWAGCMVDRITPATTEADQADVLAALGVADAAPVSTEAFSEWVIAGQFPAGRPAWDQAGVQMVDDVVPFEERKLHMLNGAHSLLAYAGSLLGHRTVGQAMADHRLLGWVEEWWDAAARHLTMPTDGYRTALKRRFTTGGAEHLLSQIAIDGSLKMPVRVADVVRAEVIADSLSDGALRPLAAWAQHLRGLGAPVSDPAAGPELALIGADVPTAVGRVLRHTIPELSDNTALTARVERLAADLSQ